MASRDQIITELEPIFQDVLDQPNLKLTPESNASNVEDWDSLAHVTLVGAWRGRRPRSRSLPFDSRPGAAAAAARLVPAGEREELIQGRRASFLTILSTRLRGPTTLNAQVASSAGEVRASSPR